MEVQKEEHSQGAIHTVPIQDVLKETCTIALARDSKGVPEKEAKLAQLTPSLLIN